VSAEEFTAGLRDCGLDLSEDRVASLVSKFDVVGDGRLACYEFIRMMSGGAAADEEKEAGAALPGAAEAGVALAVEGDEGAAVQAEIEARLEVDEGEVLRKFRMVLEEEKRMLRKTFQRIAEGGKTINAEQLLKGLRGLGCVLDGAAAERIVERFDVDGTGDLHCYEFVRMMNEVS
jgi:Ca2+-binding EF-hand superfamily protein